MPPVCNSTGNWNYFARGVGLNLARADIHGELSSSRAHSIVHYSSDVEDKYSTEKNAAERSRVE